MAIQDIRSYNLISNLFFLDREKKKTAVFNKCLLDMKVGLLGESGTEFISHVTISAKAGKFY